MKKVILVLVVLVSSFTAAQAGESGKIVGWGYNSYGQATPPAGNNFIAITTSRWYSLGLKSDGSIVGWGRNDYGQATPPVGNNFIAIAAGGDHSLALKSDGSIVGWGYNRYGQATPPVGNNFIAIAAGETHSLALKSDGSIVGWGLNYGYGQATPPAGNNFIAIAAGGYCSIALKSDGSIVGWGRNDYGQATPPAGNNFIAIAAGGIHSLALKSDGSIVGWGYNHYGQATPPAGNDFIAIAAGDAHSLALKSDGSIVAWGWNYYGQATPPAGNNFIAIAAGGDHSLALVGGGFPSNHPPESPISPQQFKSDSQTEIPIGGTTNEPTVVFSANVSDPDGDPVKLQIELRRLLDEYEGQFLNSFTQESELVDNGSQATITVFGLINGDYHWQARTVDETGLASNWVQFGSNDISQTDFTVNANPPAEGWVSVSSPDGVWRLRESPGIGKDDVLMIVPNDWVLKVLAKTDDIGNPVEQDGYVWWKVENPGNALSGWMAAENLGTSKKYLIQCDSLNAEEIYEEIARANEILGVIEHYYSNSDAHSSDYGTTSLYNSNDWGYNINNPPSFRTTNNISYLPTNQFPIDLILAIAAWESGDYEFDNQIYDQLYAGKGDLSTAGVGIMQIHGSDKYLGWDNKGWGSNLKCYAKSCTEAYEENGIYKNRYYTNTRQGIYANIKDGLRVIQWAYDESRARNSNLINQWIGAVWRYNHGPVPKKGIIANDKYLSSISRMIDPQNVDRIESYFDDYKNILQNLSPDMFLSATERQLLTEKMRTYITGEILSPVELRIFDSLGRVTGSVDGDIKNEIPDSDCYADMFLLLETDDEYSYEIEGIDSGTYGLRITFVIEDSPLTFTANDIPASPNEIHDYHIDWNALSLGEKGVTIAVDIDGDGEFEKTVTSDNELTPEEFNIDPVADAGDDQTVFVGTDCLAQVSLNGSDSNDPDGGEISYIWSLGGQEIAAGVNPAVELPLGVHTIELVVNDGIEDSQPDYVVITVLDNTPPELAVSVTPKVLWPPNHKMVQISSSKVVSDNCADSPTVTLISIVINEGEETNTFDPTFDYTLGDGHTIDDIQMINGNIYLRAERSGTGTGRVYTIKYKAADNSGNETVQSATVTVPHDQP